MDNTETKDFIEKAWDKIADLNTSDEALITHVNNTICLLYTSPSPRDLSTSRMPSSA